MTANGTLIHCDPGQQTCDTEFNYKRVISGDKRFRVFICFLEGGNWKLEPLKYAKSVLKMCFPSTF